MHGLGEVYQEHEHLSWPLLQIGILEDLKYGYQKVEVVVRHCFQSKLGLEEEHDLLEQSQEIEIILVKCVIPSVQDFSYDGKGSLLVSLDKL